MSNRNRRRRSQPSAFLLTAEALRAVLQDRLNSRLWWCFLAVRGGGMNFLAAVEKQHYRGKNGRFFELMALPIFGAGLGILTIAFAHKSRMTARQLGRLFDQWDMPREAEALARDPNRDIHALSEHEELAWRAALVLQQLSGIGEGEA